MTLSKDQSVHVHEVSLMLIKQRVNVSIDFVGWLFGVPATKADYPNQLNQSDF